MTESFETTHIGTTDAGLVAFEDIAASAYSAYSACTDNKNFLGAEMPGWQGLPDKIKDAWSAAVRQAIDVSRGGSYGLTIEQKWKGFCRPGAAVEEPPAAE